MGKKFFIIYHAGCFDGVAAAWVTKRKALMSYPEEDIILFPATYGSPPPDVKGCDVCIVDFSYPRAVLLDMKEKAEGILVLDHHHTAQEDLRGLDFCVFDMERSGAGLAWDNFFPTQNRPWLIDAVEDRDLWRFRLSGTRAILAYLAAHPLTVESFSNVMIHSKASVVEWGLNILDYISTFGGKACEHYVLKTIGGYKIPVINVPYMNGSDHVDRLANMLPEFPFHAGFFMRGDGRWQFSLRSRGDFDVSIIARMYGGGGHKQAAGFAVNVLPWETITPPVFHMPAEGFPRNPPPND